jgi:hypothetical protein
LSRSGSFDALSPTFALYLKIIILNVIFANR